jgi:Protein of unknown function (DUF3105)
VANTGNRGNDPGRRQTKAERREAARLERERIQREMRARKRNRSIGIALVAAALVIVVAVVFVTQGKDTTSAQGVPTADALLKEADAQAKAAGCGAVKDIGFYGGVSDPQSPDYEDQSHITVDSRFPKMPALSTYPSVPPASGPHWPVPLSAGVYDSAPPLDQAIHSLEHAGAIVWYAPDTPQATVDALKAFYTQSADVGQAKVVVAPYDYPDYGADGQLPAGEGMALVAWHKMQTCSSANLAAAFRFTSRYSNAYQGGANYQGVAPEANASM